MVQKTLDYFRVPKKLFWGLIVFFLSAVLYNALKTKSLDVDAGLVKKQDFQSYIIDEGVSHYKNRRTLTAPADGINPALDIEAGDPVKKNQVLYHFIWDKNIPIISPLDGVILKVFEKDRRSVIRGTPLLEVADPQSLEILLPLLSEEVVSIKVGQPAMITKWGGPETLMAKVIRVSPSAHEEVSALGVKEQRVDVYLKLVENTQLDPNKKLLLGDGFRLEVKIIKDEKKAVTTVPIGALFRKENETALYLIDNKSKASLKIVQIGDRNQEIAEIKTQLDEGQKVILYPSSQIKDGSSVKIRKEY
jgi:HlyD family secretion protein